MNVKKERTQCGSGLAASPSTPYSRANRHNLQVIPAHCLFRSRSFHGCTCFAKVTRPHLPRGENSAHLPTHTISPRPSEKVNNDIGLFVTPAISSGRARHAPSKGGSSRNKAQKYAAKLALGFGAYNARPLSGLWP